MKKIVDGLSLTEENSELDDGYYGYAFITSSKDTLFADYKKNGNKGETFGDFTHRTVLKGDVVSRS